MTRPTVRIGGEVQGGGGGGGTAQAPDWIAEGATAAWGLQETGATFEDAGDNLWDVPRPGSTARLIHPLFPGKTVRRFGGAFGSAAHAAARIVSPLSLAAIQHFEGNIGEYGIYCYSTGLTDCLWGLGQNASGMISVRDKRHGTGTLSLNTPAFFNYYHLPTVVFATRGATGIWKIYANGALLYTSGTAADPAVVGDEVIAIGGRNCFDHFGLWEEELSASEIARLSKQCIPWLDL